MIHPRARSFRVTSGGPLSQASRLLFGAGWLSLLTLIFPLFLTSCASKAQITNLMQSFQSVQSAVISELPRGLRQESPNGRELLSEYFVPGNFTQDGSTKDQRAFAKVTILGPVRPYSIVVEVFREQKIRGSNRYRSLGRDKRLSEELAKRLKAALADRREDRNVIDDFRAF